MASRSGIDDLQGSRKKQSFHPPAPIKRVKELRYIPSRLGIKPVGSCHERPEDSENPDRCKSNSSYRTLLDANSFQTKALRPIKWSGLRVLSDTQGCLFHALF